MLKIMVKETTVHTQKGVAKRTGKPYEMRSQTAYVDLGKAFPTEVKLTLGDDQQPFVLGDYTLTRECFTVNQYGELSLALRNMRPAAPAGVVR